MLIFMLIFVRDESTKLERATASILFFPMASSIALRKGYDYSSGGSVDHRPPVVQVTHGNQIMVRTAYMYDHNFYSTVEDWVWLPFLLVVN